MCHSGAAPVLRGTILHSDIMPLQVLAFVLRSKRQQFARAWQAGKEDGNMEEEGVAALRPNDSL